MGKILANGALGVVSFEWPLTTELVYTKTVMENKNLKRVSMFDAAHSLSRLCDRIDDSDFCDESLELEFQTAQLSLAESIDRRKFIYREAESKTKLVMTQEPSQPYEDTLGNKLKVVKNSQTQLVLAVDLRDKKSVSNIIDDASLELLGIDDKYVKIVTYQTLDTERVKRDLEKGEKLEWASLFRGDHVRGLR